MSASIDTWIMNGMRVRGWRGVRKGRIGTVVSAPFFGSWTDGQLRAQVSVDYDGGDAPPLRTFVMFLEPLDAVTALGKVISDE